MKAKRTLIGVALCLVIGLFLGSTAIAGIINVPADQSNIQAAIAVADHGDTIIVAAGTYNENLVVNKSLTVQGADRDTTFINGVNIGTNISTVYITATGDVMMTGFTITNAPTTNGDDLRFGILTNSTISGVTYTIKNNKVIGTNDPNNYQDFGIYGRNGGKENLVITNNVVTGTGNNNIVIETHGGTTNISSNTLDAGCYGVDAIFIMTHSGLEVSSLQKVSNNKINMGSGLAVAATGITFAAVASFYGVSPGKFLEGSIEISNNEISNLIGKRRGIGFWSDISDVSGSFSNIVSPLVTDNIITSASNPIATASMGIDTIGLVTNASIVNNTIIGTDFPFKERVWGNTIATGTKLNYNNFISPGTGVLTERTSGTLDATNNWWGDASGPGQVGSGSGTKVSNLVTYDPWVNGLAYTGETLFPVTNSVILKATLLNSTSGAAGPGAHIFFSLDGDFKGSAITDANGVATFNIGPVPVGVYTARASLGPDCAPVEALLAIYDPTAGFVTGGGWIMSPMGAYDGNLDLTGQATFGFVSKYQKGKTIPTGNTEFQFKAGDLNFKSTSYYWLVIAGVKAQFKGIGTINGTGEYGFMLTAIDGQVNGGGGVDKFRIKIWNKANELIIYDNQRDADDSENPTTVISGGSIVIHK